MKFTPKQVPEGINTSTVHPIKELILLIGTTVMIIAGIIYFIILSTDYLVRYIPIALEYQLFQNQFIESTSSPATSELPPLEQYLNELTHQLQTVHGDTEYPFSVHIIDSQIPNAFAYPGGNIGVTTGLLTLVTSENALAMVLGHEMGHHYARDPIKGAGRGIIIALFLYAVIGVGSDAWLQSLVSDLTLVGLMKFSRDQERAADQVGKILLKKHYGHLGGATEFFEKLTSQKSFTANSMSFFDSHPNPAERIATLNNQEEPQVELQALPKFFKDVKPITYWSTTHFT